MNEELKAELIKKFTIESKGKNLACAYPPEKLIDWIDENFIQKSWSTEKPAVPCLFVHRYSAKDQCPTMGYAILSEGVLCITNIETDEFSMTMEEFTDKGEFFIIERY